MSVVGVVDGQGTSGASGLSGPEEKRRKSEKKSEKKSASSKSVKPDKSVKSPSRPASHLHLPDRGSPLPLLPTPNYQIWTKSGRTGSTGWRPCLWPRRWTDLRNQCLEL